ncbi:MULTISPECIES: hypothetical protein [unclassified Streptomyces]|uniref:hypothetical protein n=1 Tax=unclassified Streptomyces TaxID=2593676 RepID=UPI000805B8FB|nr:MULTISPECIES: hypothetical protein [unclassified Streptomyces]MYR75169.1 hypothetical protein [Streptomyces sp. SID4925]SBU98083.1 hypothetical protein YUMDRAFT_06044 [Streptomyces sp. OspMP-M45]
MPTKTTTPAPPAEAVAKDAHWAATREKLRNRTRPTVALTICDDLDLRVTLESAKHTLRRIKAAAEDRLDDSTGPTAVAQAEQDVTDAQEAYDAASIVLRFQALPRLEFEALKKAHPATEDQAEDGHDLNVESLGPELIAKASMDGMTADDAREYLDTWSEAEASALFNAAWNVQEAARMDLGKG